MKKLPKIELEYARIVAPQVKGGRSSRYRKTVETKFISRARVGRIYKVIERGTDWVLLQVNGKPVYIDSYNIEASNREDYLNQDKKAQVEEQFEDIEEQYENI